MRARGLYRLSLALLGLGLLGPFGCASTEDPPGEVASVSSQGKVAPPVALALVRALEVDTGGSLPDGVVSRRLEKLRAELAQAAGVPEGALHPLATHEPRLQSLPGGRIVISRGLLAGLASANQRQPLIAALLAHEVSYASLGYAQADLLVELRALGHGRIAAEIAPLVSEGRAAPADAASLAAARRVTLKPSPCSPARLARRERADRLAVRLLARAGYAPDVLPRAWERVAKLEERDPDAFAVLRAGHGSGLERARAARAAVEELGRLPAQREPEFELELARLVLADRERALLDAARGLARAGRTAEVEAIVQGPAALRAEGEWLGLLARHVALSRAKGEDAKAGGVLDGELRRLLLRDARHAGARLLLAKRYLSAGRKEDAAREARALVARSPLWAEAQLLLARGSADPGAARARAELARDLDVPGGRIAEAARRFLAGEGSEPAPLPDPSRPSGSRRLLGGGK